MSQIIDNSKMTNDANKWKGEKNRNLCTTQMDKELL